MSESKAALKQAIEEFYLPQNLVKAIHEIGQIPSHSTESHVGIGFIDIADYTFMSKFLSPKENQIVLNGLYTAFQTVLERHGGYLNKIEGDSMMFHFDGIINSQFRRLDPAAQKIQIARELFFTCVEMQRVCALFNQANDRFVDPSANARVRQALQGAFDIMSNLRNSTDTASVLHAFFQIRIRIGANLGEVTIGNFGPDGAKQWDVIGMPVIHAKRMEATAPIGGLRISEDFFTILQDSKVVDDYHQRFKREATLMGSIYRDITKDELFSFREVVIQQKRNAAFKTYSVQVNPALPETIVKQVTSLLDHGEQGANRIIELFQYYRGNRFVVQALEACFAERGIHIRKHDMLNFLQPKALKDLATGSTTPSDLEHRVDEKFTLVDLFKLMDGFQDSVQRDILHEPVAGFDSYDAVMKRLENEVKSAYETRKFNLVQRTYFFEVVYPLVFLSLKNAIRESQTMGEDEAEIETLERLED